jgi:hypothetical protein
MPIHQELRTRQRIINHQRTIYERSYRHRQLLHRHAHAPNEAPGGVYHRCKPITAIETRYSRRPNGRSAFEAMRENLRGHAQTPIITYLAFERGQNAQLLHDEVDRHSRKWLGEKCIHIFLEPTGYKRTS